MSEDKAVQDLMADVGQVSTLDQEVLEPVLGDAPDVGQQLRSAREARGISVGVAAAKLRLSVRQVQEMEANDWSHLPRTVSRGFVRNYARYLELEIEPLMEALDQVEMPRGPELVVGASSVNMPRAGKRERRDYARVAAGLVALALAILACFFIFSIPVESWRSALDAVKALVSENKALPAPAVPPDAASPPSVAESPVAVVAAPSMPVVPDSGPASLPPADTYAAQPSPVTDSGGEMLVFSFSDSSWVEVRDGGGQILFSQTSPSGSRHEVTGQPPFSLVIGNASHVTLRYRGKPVDLTQRSSRDDVARLVLE
jgi:cytoskeleton protein RodZ